MAKDPKSSIMQSGIGWAYWNLKDYARARQSWNDALALDPKNVDAWAAMAWIDLAMGKTAESKKGFQELVAFNREKKDWVLGLSMAQGGNNDLKQINSFFPLPPLESFNSPLVPDPAASQPAATNP